MTLTRRRHQRLRAHVVLRDGKFYLARPTWSEAKQEADILSLNGNSKHRWTVVGAKLLVLSGAKGARR